MSLIDQMGKDIVSPMKEKDTFVKKKYLTVVSFLCMIVQAGDKYGKNSGADTVI